MITHLTMSDRQEIVAGWFDRSMTAQALADTFGVKVHDVYYLWETAKQLGELPRESRDKFFLFNRDRVTVDEEDTGANGAPCVGRDHLLLRLRKVHPERDPECLSNDAGR